MSIATENQQARMAAAAQAYLDAVAVPEFTNLDGTENAFDVVAEKVFVAASAIFAALNVHEDVSPVAVVSGVGRAVGVLGWQLDAARWEATIEGLRLGVQIGFQDAREQFAPKGRT